MTTALCNNRATEQEFNFTVSQWYGFTHLYSTQYCHATTASVDRCLCICFCLSWLWDSSFSLAASYRMPSVVYYRHTISASSFSQSYSKGEIVKRIILKVTFSFKVFSRALKHDKCKQIKLIFTMTQSL